jgi:hypothetical protein
MADMAISKVIPAEVARFAEEQGVAGLLEPVLAMTESVFPGSQPTLELDDDPEIVRDRHIVIEVKSRNHDVEDGLAKLDRWHEGLFQCCPSIHAHLFRIGLRLV